MAPGEELEGGGEGTRRWLKGAKGAEKRGGNRLRVGLGVEVGFGLDEAEDDDAGAGDEGDE
jgi:hypothetical protein